MSFDPPTPHSPSTSWYTVDSSRNTDKSPDTEGGVSLGPYLDDLAENIQITSVSRTDPSSSTTTSSTAPASSPAPSTSPVVSIPRRETNDQAQSRAFRERIASGSYFASMENRDPNHPGCSPWEPVSPNVSPFTRPAAPDAADSADVQDKHDQEPKNVQRKDQETHREENPRSEHLVHTLAIDYLRCMQIALACCKCFYLRHSPLSSRVSIKDWQKV